MSFSRKKSTPKTQNDDVKALQAEVQLLRGQVAYLMRQLHGKRSEKGLPELDDPAQPGLFDGQDFEVIDEAAGEEPGGDDEDEENQPAAERPKKCRPTRKARLPKHLPVEETVLDPEEVKFAPDAWTQIGEERTDRLAFRPPRYYIKRLTRRKYIKKVGFAESGESAPLAIAPLPPQLLDRGTLDASFLANIVIEKYSDHLPLTRQAKIIKERHGVEVSKQTMCNGAALVAEWLRPVVDAMGREQFRAGDRESGYVQIDETPIKYLRPGTGKTAQGYLWAVHVPGGDTVYHWHPGRGQVCLEKIIPHDFRGSVQCDGYRVYPAVQKRRNAALGGSGENVIELNGCLAHIRRKFWEALEQGQDAVRNRWVLGQIQLLYRIEARLRESRAGPAKREAVRQSESRPVFNRIENALHRFEKSRKHLPKSLTGKAISYALKQWANVGRWLEDGRFEIDNNLIENKIRPTKLGAKNWLFIGAEDTGWRSAVIYSIIESCRNHGIEPYAYLADVLERLPSMTTDQIKDILPSVWKKKTNAGNQKLQAA